MRHTVFKKHLGQHFLHDEEALEREASLLECKSKRVLEIGAGDGRLTRHILAKRPSELQAVEIDKRLASKLESKFGGIKNLKIINQDILLYLGRPAIFFDRAIGNIPYKISGPLFSRLAKMKFELGVFCVQQELAQRICAKPGTREWGRLSVTVQLNYDAKPMFKIPRESFHPMPKVDSQVILLRQKKCAPVLPENFHDVVRVLFSHRLQTLGNSIIHSHKQLGIGKMHAKELSKTIKYAKKRVFSLTIREWIEVSRSLGS